MNRRSLLGWLVKAPVAGVAASVSPADNASSAVIMHPTIHVERAADVSDIFAKIAAGNLEDVTWGPWQKFNEAR